MSSAVAVHGAGHCSRKAYTRVKMLPVAGLLYTVFGALRATRRTLHWVRPCALLCTLLIAACAGPDTRIKAPQQTATPLPLVAAHGAAGRAEERKVLERALHGGHGAQDDAELIEHVRKNIAHTSLVAGNRALLLTDGPSTFGEFARAIADASHHIHVETFIFSDDKLGRSFAKLLAEKSRQGVEVRVLYDSIGSWAADDEVFKLMRDAGVEVQAFQPLDSVDVVLSGRINQRDHRKILIVDGRVAFVGGINISGTYNMGSSLKPGKEQGLADGWRDTQVRISGPVVQQFQALFFATWAQAAGQQTPAMDDYFPPIESNGRSIIAALASEPGAASEAAIHGVHLAAINAAKRRLWITQAYFAPDLALREALIAAARRGVDVRVLLPGFSDSETVLSASRAVYGDLLEGQVRIYEFDEAFVHAKTMVVDDSVSLVGSANMDYRSALDNNEVTALIVDADFVTDLATVFLRDLAGASEITLAQWQQRPAKQRVMERAATLLWRWL